MSAANSGAADRLAARMARGEPAVHVQSVRDRLERIKTGRADAVDLLPGRLAADVELLLRVVDRRDGGA